jgi:hypothetical protein
MPIKAEKYGKFIFLQVKSGANICGFSLKTGLAKISHSSEHSQLQGNAYFSYLLEPHLLL